MLNSIAAIFFVFVFSLNVYGQDFPIPKEPHIVSLRSKPFLSSNTITGKKPTDLSTLYRVLPHSNSASYSARGPIGTYYYERGIYLITPAEMSAVGIPAGISINRIAWTYYTPGNIPVTGNLKVYLENTSNTTNTKSTTWIDAVRTMTFVDNNTSFTIPASDYVIENFSAPSAFTYTGGGLYIAFDYSGSSLNTGTAIYINTDLVNGNLMAQSNTSSPVTVAPVNSRPETYLGFSIANDAQVVQIYTMGKLPIPYEAPHNVIAAVKNNGFNDLYNINTTLNISGANIFSDVKSIDTLLSGQIKFVTFASWTPTVIGTDTVRVSVPPDDLNSNNSDKIIQVTTLNDYSYAYGPFPYTVDGGIGFNGQTGDFVEKFSANLSPSSSGHLNSVASVSQVKVNFTVSGQPFRIGIWDAAGSGGTPGQLLWQSASLTSTTGVSTIPVNPKVGVSGNFYVGVRQIGTTNIAAAYQSEDPVRENTFYAASPTGSSAWVDFAVSGNPFRFIIEPGLTVANDVGVSSIDLPMGGTYNNLTSNIAPKATISNFGTNNQASPFNVTMDIYNFDDIRIYSSTKTLSLNAGTSQQITFDAAFNPAAEFYYANCYTSLGSDGNNTNDMVSASFNYGQFSLNLTALIQGFFDGTSMVPDTVTVELHDTTSQYLLHASQKVVLNTSGIGTMNYFTAPLNNIFHYYIVVKHRNSIETWSAYGNLFNPSALNYDFTLAATQAYGNNLILKDGKYCLYSGDVNQDGYVSLADYNLVNNDSYNQVTGFTVTDLTGDQFVNLADYNIVNNNTYIQVKAYTPLFSPLVTKYKQ